MCWTGWFGGLNRDVQVYLNQWRICRHISNDARWSRVGLSGVDVQGEAGQCQALCGGRNRVVQVHLGRDEPLRYT